MTCPDSGHERTLGAPGDHHSVTGSFGAGECSECGVAGLDGIRTLVDAPGGFDGSVVVVAVANIETERHSTGLRQFSQHGRGVTNVSRHLAFCVCARPRSQFIRQDGEVVRGHRATAARVVCDSPGVGGRASGGMTGRT